MKSRKNTHATQKTQQASKQANTASTASTAVKLCPKSQPAIVRVRIQQLSRLPTPGATLYKTNAFLRFCVETLHPYLAVVERDLHAGEADASAAVGVPGHGVGGVGLGQRQLS